MTDDNQRELAQLVQRDHMPKRIEPELALVIAEVVSRREDGAITQTRAIRDATAEELADHPHLLRGAVAGAYGLLSQRMLQEGQWKNA